VTQAETRYEHVVLNETRTAIISGTRTKVVELVAEKAAYGWSPEELHFQHPDLTLGQIYSALAYYWDHQEELDKEVMRRLERTDQLRNQLRPLPDITRLKALRKR